MPRAEYGGFLQSLTLKGRAGSLVWGYKPAATLATWTIERKRDEWQTGWEWTLRAGLTGKIDAFALRQRPLLATLPRKGGFLTFPVRRLDVIETPPGVLATLGPPEH